MLRDLLTAMPQTKVLEVSGKYVPIDLSDNVELPSNSAEFHKYIDGYILQNHAVAAYGGYCEVRNLYKRSGIFNAEGAPERNIHIGLDLWTSAGRKVIAALDGKIHSFKNNTGLGNYGPTIILEHDIDRTIFYTLYGHLSLESLDKLKTGDFFKSGETLGSLGDASENGDYAPHLHFQVIADLGDNFGDYPGVCTKSDLEYYLGNCPDPNLLLKLNSTK